MSYLKDLRNISGFTIEECAEIVNLTKEEYEEYENGKVDPKTITLKEFAQLCRLVPVSIDPLFFLEQLKIDYIIKNNLMNTP